MSDQGCTPTPSSDEIADLRARLEEAEETLRAIRSGEVDAIVIHAPDGPQLFSLKSAEAESNRVRGDILGQVSDAVISVDLEQRVIFINKSAERQYGVTANEALGRKLSEIFTVRWPTPDDEAAARTALRERGEWRGENVHLTRGGAELQAESTVTLLRDSDGTESGALAVLRDITGRMQSEAALRDAKQRLEQTLAATEVATWTWDVRTNRVQADRNLARLFSVAPEDAEGGPLAHYLRAIHPDDLPRAEALMAEAMQSASGEYQTDYRLIQTDGSIRWVTARGKGERDAAGQTVRFPGVVIDITERKEAEDLLRKNRDTFFHLIEHAPFGVYVVDSEFRVRQVSAGSQKAFQNVRPLLGRDFAEVMRILWPESFASEAIARFRHTLKTGEPYVAPPLTERRADVDAVESYDWKIERLALPDGHWGVVCYFYDVTERKQAEDALRASEERFRVAVLAVSNLVWTNNAQGMMEGEQPGWGQFTGQTQAEYQGYGWSKAVHPDDAQPTVNAWNLAVAEKRMFQFEHRVRRHDGEWRLCSIRAVPVVGRDGEIREWVGVHTDITEDRNVEQQLRESEARFRDLTDNLPQLAWIADVHTDGQVHWFNKGWFDYTGTTLEEMRGSGWQKVHHPDHAARVVEKFERHVREGLDWEDTFPLRRADGEFRWFLSRMKVIRNAAGEVVRLFGTNTDVTEQREAANALARAKEEVEAASRAKDDFLAALSHELRTPLTPVLMTASSLETDTALPIEVRDQLGMMRRNIELEARLIDDLLDITRISRGKLTIAPVSTDLHQLLDHTAEIVRSDERGKQVRILFQLEAARHHALADPTRIQQVFWNLVKNALKFTPTGGSIVVRTRNDDEGWIVISVEDTGIGIAAEALPHIFKAFEQGDIAGQHRYGGLGLGLAISQAIVEVHGGAIHADSKGAGLGATFTVTLSTVDAPAAAAPARTGHPAPVRVLRLLVVEDHEATRVVLARLLTRSGHHVTTAGSLREALTTFAAERFDAIISDLGLPDGSGLDLMREIQRQRPVPGIALSGYGMEDDLRQTKEAGFFAHLVKPVNMDQLRQLIGQLAERIG